jgi:hypothetical protein
MNRTENFAGYRKGDFNAAGQGLTVSQPAKE